MRLGKFKRKGLKARTSVALPAPVLAARVTGSRGVVRLRDVEAEGSRLSLQSMAINALPLLREDISLKPLVLLHSAIRPVSMRGFMEVFLNVTHHLHSLGLRDETPSLNAQFYNTVSYASLNI